MNKAIIYIILLILFFCSPISAQPGFVLYEQKISDTQGMFTGILDDDDRMGVSVTSLGDLNGDGIKDLAVGSYLDDDGGSNHGAVWIMFLDSNSNVLSHQKISDTQGNFSGSLSDVDVFGNSVASIGDLDGDGITDLAVGAMYDDDGGTDHGAVWILFLDTNGTVKSHQKISDIQGGFSGILGSQDVFGVSICSLGDLDGDGVVDIAVGALGDDDGGTDRGAVWILFLNSDGTVKSHQKISDTQGGFTGVVSNVDYLGISVANIGDLDGDGVTDIAVGAYYDDDGGGNRGAVWILFLNNDGTVLSHQKISDIEGGFTGILDNTDGFGNSLASVGDLDGDGLMDIAVGAFLDDDGGTNRGAVWMLFLNADGTVGWHQKISDLMGNMTGIIDDSDFFGASLSSDSDLNGDSITDLIVGAFYDDDGGADRGAVWVLFMDGIPPCIVYSTTIDTSICLNDSIYLEGAWQDSSGTYDDTLTAVTGCDSIIETTLTVNNCTGIENFGLINTLKVYPNPTKDQLYIDNGDYLSMSGYTLKIVNSVGQDVFSSLITIPLFVIDISTLGSTGLYYIQVIDGSSNVLENKKLVLN